jgi:hypothetical protein
VVEREKFKVNLQEESVTKKKRTEWISQTLIVVSSYLRAPN